MKASIEKKRIGAPETLDEAVEHIRKLNSVFIGRLVLEGLISIYGVAEHGDSPSEIEDAQKAADAASGVVAHIR